MATDVVSPPELADAWARWDRHPASPHAVNERLAASAETAGRLGIAELEVERRMQELRRGGRTIGEAAAALTSGDDTP